MSVVDLRGRARGWMFLVCAVLGRWGRRAVDNECRPDYSIKWHHFRGIPVCTHLVQKYSLHQWFVIQDLMQYNSQIIIPDTFFLGGGGGGG